MAETMYKKSISFDEDTALRLEAIKEAFRESGYEHSRSAVFRAAILLLYKHVVLGESLVHPDDPRFS